MSLITQLSPMGFFAAGLAASGHCALMCGPLIALSANNRPSASTALRQVAMPNVQLQAIGQLQLGRVVSYSAMGMVVGMLGSQFSQAISPALAVNLRIGLLGVMAGLLALWWFRKPNPHAHCQSSLKSSGMTRSPFVRGALLAFIPCPLLITVLIYCGLTASPLTAGLSMLSFGVAAALLPSLAAAGLQHWQSKYLPYSRGIAVFSLLGLGISVAFFMPYFAPALACL